MAEIAQGTQPAVLSPDAAYVWWGGTWAFIPPGSLSTDKQWVMLEGQWHPAVQSAPAQAQAVPILPQQQGPADPLGAGRQTAARGLPQRTSNARGSGNTMAIAGFVTGGAGLVAAVVFALLWLSAPDSKTSQPAQAQSQSQPAQSGSNASRAPRAYAASMKSDLRTVAQEIESANVDVQDYMKIPFGAGLPKPGVSISGRAQNVGFGSVALSAGNTITWVSGNSMTVCLKATHSGESTWYYDTAAGGITQTACTASRP